jgi:hypothetical protein
MRVAKPAARFPLGNRSAAMRRPLHGPAPRQDLALYSLRSRIPCGREKAREFCNFSCLFGVGWQEFILQFQGLLYKFPADWGREFLTLEAGNFICPRREFIAGAGKIGILLL